MQARGPDLVPAAAKALARYLMERRNEVLALESGKAIVEWVDAHLEDALAIAAGMQSINDQLADHD